MQIIDHALILGVSSQSGFGWALAQAYVRQHIAVTISCREDKLERVKKFAHPAGAKVVTYDALVKDDNVRLAHQVNHNVSDLFYCIAATNRDEMTSHQGHPTRDEDIRAALASDIAFGEVVLSLKDRLRGGSVAALSFIGAERYVDGYDNMAPHKAALERRALNLAVVHAKDDIRVNTIRLPTMNTPAGQAIPGRRAINAFVEAKSPTGQLPSKEQLAEAVLRFMAVPLITGQTITIDGGSSMMEGFLPSNREQAQKAVNHLTP